MSGVGPKYFFLEELLVDRRVKLAISDTDSDGIPTTQAPSPQSIYQPGEGLGGDRGGKNQPSVFNASKLLVSGGNINQYNHFYNLNLPQLPKGAHIEIKTVSDSSSQNQHLPSTDASSISQSSNAEASRISLSQQPDTDRAIPEVEANNIKYERHMSKKGQGFPLWIPECSHTLHIKKRQVGVEVGDVGLIDKDGCFVFLFNIRLPANHPFHPESMPAGYTPVQPLNPHNLVENNPYGPHTALASAHVRMLESNPTDSRTSRFHSSEGVILTLPEGVQSFKVHTDWTSYMKRHLGSWYRLVKVTLCYNVNNGDIRLITGCHKTSCWGMAVTEQPPTAQESYKLSFRPASDENGPVRHMWACNGPGMVDTRVGPNQENIREVRQKSQKTLSLFRRLRSPEAKPTKLQRNQCVFIKSINITLDEKSWNEIEREAEELHNNGGSSSSYMDPSLSSSSGSSWTSAGASKGKNPASGSQSSAAPGPMSRLGFVNDTSQAQRLYTDNHPADWLSKFLRLLYPGAQNTVIYDEDWCFAMGNIPDPGPMNENEVICAVLLEFDFKLQDDVVQALYVNNREPLETTRRVAEIVQSLPDNMVPGQGTLKDLIFTLDRAIYVFETADIFRNSSAEGSTKRLANVTNPHPSSGHPAGSEVNFDPSFSWTIIAIFDDLANVLDPRNSSNPQYEIACANFRNFQLFHNPGDVGSSMKNLEPLKLCRSELKRIDLTAESGSGSMQSAETQGDTENLRTDIRPASLDVVSIDRDDVPSEWKELAEGKAVSQPIRQVQIQEINQDDIIILVMGPTGSGKSSFVQASERVFQGSDRRNCHTITEKHHDLDSGTEKVQCLSIAIPNKTSKLILVDTPGFDDRNRSDSEILSIIGDWLKDTYIQKKQINGIVYMHRINNIRFDVGIAKTFNIFQRICGSGEACGRVVFTTSGWNNVSPSEWKTHEEREMVLKTGPWKGMLARTADAATTSRFDTTTEDTERNTVMQTLWTLVKSTKKVVLQLQKELVDKRLDLTRTTAGKLAFSIEQRLRYQLKGLSSSLSMSN